MDKPVTAEYKFGKAVVRAHGEPDMDNFKKATVQFMKKVREERLQQDTEAILIENAKKPTKKRLQDVPGKSGAGYDNPIHERLATWWQ